MSQTLWNKKVHEILKSIEINQKQSIVSKQLWIGVRFCLNKILLIFDLCLLKTRKVSKFYWKKNYKILSKILCKLSA